jgi:hypothetical protein
MVQIGSQEYIKDVLNVFFSFNSEIWRNPVITSAASQNWKNTSSEVRIRFCPKAGSFPTLVMSDDNR